MGKGCSICAHPNVQEIDSLLDSGQFKKEVAAQFSVSVHALSRHGRGLCRTDALDQEEEKWNARLEKTYQQAVTDQDVRGQQQVATTALRHVRARKAERKAAAKAASDADSGMDDGKINVGSLDDVCQMFDAAAASSSPIDQEKLREAYRRAKLLNLPDMMTIFYKAIEDSVFAQDLVRWVALWEPAQKGEPDESQSLPQATAPN